MRASVRESGWCLRPSSSLYIATGEPVASQAVARLFADQRGPQFGHAAQRDGHAGRGGTAGAAAHLGRPRSHRRGLPLLRGADHPARGADGPHAGRAQAAGMRRAATRLAAERSAARADRGELYGRDQHATTIWSAPRTCWRCFRAAWAWRWPAPPQARCWSIFIFRGFRPAGCWPCW